MLDDMTKLSAQELSLPARFARIKSNLIHGKEDAIRSSWRKLLVRLRDEIELVSRVGSSIIPCINFNDIANDADAHDFTARLRKCGAGVIRGAVPKDVVLEWKNETVAYISNNPEAGSYLGGDTNLQPVYWSPGQVKSRAYPNVLTVQKFLMGAWHSADPEALVSDSFPVAYADRLRLRDSSGLSSCKNPCVDGGSVERWEPDGYGTGSTYQKIWDGEWESYDPWESSSRLKVTSDLYSGAGACSMFRMFQGMLSLSTLSPSDGTVLLCPMIQLSTAYLLLRPFFTPRNPDPEDADYLSPDNWILENPPSSKLQGAVPSYTQVLSNHLHPHLCFDESMVQIPTLEPGDYIVWHCDSVFSFDNATTPPPKAGATPSAMYMPTCPLTQTNALYLARQRKAFLLGLPSPDFGGGSGESFHMSRPGVQEVNETGGDEGLRAMGLLPWDDDEASNETEAELIDTVNAILFPDMYD